MSDRASKRAKLTISKNLVIAERIKLDQDFASVQDEFNVRLRALGSMKRSAEALNTVTGKLAVHSFLKAFVPRPYLRIDDKVLQLVFYGR